MAGADAAAYHQGLPMQRTVGHSKCGVFWQAGSPGRAANGGLPVWILTVEPPSVPPDGPISKASRGTNRSTTWT